MKPIDGNGFYSRRWSDRSRSRLYRAEGLMSLDEELEFATSHVEVGRRMVARQRELIAKLADVGCSTLDAEQTLKVFRSTLTLMEAHEQLLIREKKEASTE